MSTQHSPVNSPLLSVSASSKQGTHTTKRTHTEKTLSISEDVLDNILQEQRLMRQSFNAKLDQISKYVEDIINENSTLHLLIDRLHAHQLDLTDRITELVKDSTNANNDITDNDDASSLIPQIKQLQEQFEARHKALKDRHNNILHKCTQQQLSDHCAPAAYKAMQNYRTKLEKWYPHAQITLKHILQSPNKDITQNHDITGIITNYKQTILDKEHFDEITKPFQKYTHTMNIKLLLADLEQTLISMDNVEKEESTNTDLTDIAKAKAWKAVARGHGDLSDRTIFGRTTNPTTDKQTYTRRHDPNSRSHDKYHQETNRNLPPDDRHRNNYRDHHEYRNTYTSRPYRQHPHYNNSEYDDHSRATTHYRPMPTHPYYHTDRYADNFPPMEDRDINSSYRAHKYDNRRRYQRDNLDDHTYDNDDRRQQYYNSDREPYYDDFHDHTYDNNDRRQQHYTSDRERYYDDNHQGN